MEANTLISAAALAYALFSKSELEADYKKAIQEQSDAHNAAINALSDDFQQQINDFTLNTMDGIKCNMEVTLSGIVGYLWQAKFILNIHNTTQKTLYFKGVRMAWEIAGRRSLWFPYVYGNEYSVKPGKCLSLMLSYGDHKYFDKEARTAIRELIEQTTSTENGLKKISGTGTATFVRFVKGYEEDQIQYVENIPVSIIYNKGVVYTPVGSMNKNGADIAEFDQ